MPKSPSRKCKRAADWTLVSLDVDQNEIEVRKLGIGPIPALRMFNPQGRLIRSHDGYLPAAELIALLADTKAAGGRRLTTRCSPKIGSPPPMCQS